MMTLRIKAKKWKTNLHEKRRGQKETRNTLPLNLAPKKKLLLTKLKTRPATRRASTALNQSFVEPSKYGVITKDFVQIRDDDSENKDSSSSEAETTLMASSKVEV